MSLLFLWFYVREHPKAQPAVVLVLKRLRRRDISLKSHQTDWEKPGIEPATPGLQDIGLSLKQFGSVVFGRTYGRTYSSPYRRTAVERRVQTLDNFVKFYKGQVSITARNICDHGDFMKWIGHKIGCSISTVYRYISYSIMIMRYAEQFLYSNNSRI